MHQPCQPIKQAVNQFFVSILYWSVSLRQLFSHRSHTISSAPTHIDINHHNPPYSVVQKSLPCGVILSCNSRKTVVEGFSCNLCLWATCFSLWRTMHPCILITLLWTNAGKTTEKHAEETKFATKQVENNRGQPSWICFLLLFVASSLLWSKQYGCFRSSPLSLLSGNLT